MEHTFALFNDHPEGAAPSYERMSTADLLTLLIGPSARTLSRTPLAVLFGMDRPAPQGLFAEQDPPPYARTPPQLAAAKELYLRALQEDLTKGKTALGSPDAVKAFLIGRLSHLRNEVFWCLWLDSQNRLIEAEELFRGTLTQTSVFPRPVVQSALAKNAAAGVFAHVHPSGLPTPSHADELLTRTLKTALALVDVRVLDHIVVGANKAVSFAESGLL